jgi:hypothetical protein
MAAAKGQKCARPVCSCRTTSDKHCSTQCEAMEKTPDADCSCGHAVCMLSNWGAHHTLRTTSPARPRPSD